MSLKKLSRGFTLIEMIIVLGILGILAVVLIVAVNPIDQLRKSNDADRKSDLSQMQRALELYYQDNGAYPPSSGDFKLFIGSTTLAWGSAWLPYIKALPKDPTASRTYAYYVPASGNGQTYYLYASLERGGKDSQACNSGNACTTIGGSGFPTASACGGTCNYAISSPNVTP